MVARSDLQPLAVKLRKDWRVVILVAEKSSQMRKT